MSKGSKAREIMAQKLTKITIIVLLICSLAVLATAFSLGGVAYAADGKIDVVVTAEFENGEKIWSASVDNVSFWAAQGEFFIKEELYYSLKQSLSGVLLQKRVITSDTKTSFDSDAESWNANDYFDFTFIFPSMGTVSANKTSITYTKGESDAVISVEDSSAVVGFWSSRLDYRKVGATDTKQTYSDIFSTSVSFGSGVNAGAYEVGYTAIERFMFDNKWFDVERKSTDTINFTIGKATLPVPTINTVEAEYGISVSQVSSRIRNSITDEAFLSTGSGHFILCDSQTDALFDGATDKGTIVPTPRAQEYILKYNFESASGNYFTLENISVRLHVAPRRITVRISDVYTLVGEDLIPIENVGYTIDDSLVGSDTQADLGVRLNCSADKDTPGVYPITASFDNPYYEAVSASIYGGFVQYGRYMVFTKRVSATAPDGNIFEIYYDKGFVEIKTAKITLIDAQSAIDGKKIVCAYKIELADNDGNVIEPDGDYYVSWKGTINDAKYISIGLDDKLEEVGAYINGVPLSKDNCEIYFYVDDVVPTSRKGWLDILLVSLATLFALGLIVVIVSCRKAMTIGDVLHDSSVYTREIDAKTDDCAKNEQNLQANDTGKIATESVVKSDVSPVSNTAKKQRHGKANKLKNAARKNAEEDNE